MMRWFLYLPASLVMQVVAWIITPILPMFAVIRYGKLDNGNAEGMGVRLPTWLSWFDTPDNSLCGDNTFIHKNPTCSYWSKVKWLYRNSLYGFKWTVLAADVDQGRIFEGDTKINYRGPVFGTLKVKCGKYWQWKCVKKISKNYCLVLNFGWLLDDLEKDKALFMFSPRLKRIIYVDDGQ